MMRMMRTLGLLILLAAPAAGQGIGDLPSFYKSAAKDQEAHYKMTLDVGGKQQQFEVAYRVKVKGFVGITIETERRQLKAKDEEQGRILTNEFTMSQRSFKEQLEFNYKKYGYREIKHAGGGPQAAGKKVKLKVGGKEYECFKIVSKFRAKKDGRNFSAEETYFFHPEIPVMGMARIEAIYEFETTGGRVTQKITLELTKTK